MANEKSQAKQSNKGILGNISGTVGNVVFQKNGNTRIVKRSHSIPKK